MISKKTDTLLTRVLIVLIAFPALAYTLSLIFALPLMLVCGLLFPLGDGNWSNSLGFSILILSYVVGMASSFLICRGLWPGRKTENQVSG